jgi:hypothetical protein
MIRLVAGRGRSMQHAAGADNAAPGAAVDRADAAPYLAAAGAAPGTPPARWQSGHAEDCKSLDVGSIPARASTSGAVAFRAASGYQPRAHSGVAQR